MHKVRIIGRGTVTETSQSPDGKTEDMGAVDRVYGNINTERHHRSNPHLTQAHIAHRSCHYKWVVIHLPDLSNIRHVSPVPLPRRSLVFRNERPPYVLPSSRAGSLEGPHVAHRREDRKATDFPRISSTRATRDDCARRTCSRWRPWIWHPGSH